MSGKKTKILLLSVGVLLLAGVASFATVARLTAIANDTDCSDPLAAMVRKEVSSGVKDEFLAKKMAELPFLERIEAKICARRFMTEDEINREHAAIKPPPMPVGGDQIPTPIPNAPTPDLGVIYDEQNPKFLMGDPGTGKDYVITAELLTEVQGQKVAVYSGYHVSDPLQGEVFATAPGGGMVGSGFYPTPTATGPAKLVAVNGSVVSLVTRGGTYEKDEAGSGIKIGMVTTRGGARFEFDLATRTFK